MSRQKWCPKFKKVPGAYEARWRRWGRLKVWKKAHSTKWGWSVIQTGKGSVASGFEGSRSSAEGRACHAARFGW